MYSKNTMQRGVIGFTNSELRVLYNVVVLQGCERKELLNKISPVNELENSTEAHNILISEDEAEIMLDCMPIPDENENSNLANAKIKIQQFLAKSRFPESSL